MITLAHRPCLPSSLIHLAPCSKRHHGALICGDDVHCFSWDFFDRRPRGLAPEDSPPESPADRPQVSSLTGSLQEAMQGMDEDSTQRPPHAWSVSAAALAGGGLSSAVGLLSPSPFFNPLAEIQPSAGFQRMTLMCGVCIQKSRDAQSISTQISTFGGFDHGCIEADFFNANTQ